MAHSVYRTPDPLCTKLLLLYIHVTLVWKNATKTCSVRWSPRRSFEECWPIKSV